MGASKWGIFSRPGIETSIMDHVYTGEPRGACVCIRRLLKNVCDTILFSLPLTLAMVRRRNGCCEISRLHFRFDRSLCTTAFLRSSFDISDCEASSSSSKSSSSMCPASILRATIGESCGVPPRDRPRGADACVRQTCRRCKPHRSVFGAFSQYVRMNVRVYN